MCNIIYILLTATSSGRDGYRPDRVRLQQVDRPPRRRFLERFRTPSAVVHRCRIAVVGVSWTSAPGRCGLVSGFVHSHVCSCVFENGRVVSICI